MARTRRDLLTRSLSFCLASLMIAAGCQPTPAPTPTSAPAKPAANPAPAGSPAAGTPAPTASGPIERIDGRVLTVTTNSGPRQVQVAESARIEQEGKGVIADLQPGLSVGITSLPDGTAKSIRVFPAALGTPKPGQFPMAGAEQGNLMTNSVIQSFDGSTLTVAAAGTTFQITVPLETEVLKPLAASFSDLTAGKRVLASGTASADGTLVASSVNILGTPPTLAQ